MFTGGITQKFMFMKRTLLTMAALALLAGAPAIIRAADTNSPGSSVSVVVKPYPLDHCLVCGDKVGGTNSAVIVNYDGQEMKFCCKRCVQDFNKNPEKYLKKLKEAEKQGDTH